LHFRTTRQFLSKIGNDIDVISAALCNERAGGDYMTQERLAGRLTEGEVVHVR